jgi:DNA gyrase/topoisomerase IV subunit B
VFSFANNINTHEGGSHLTGFKSALTRTLNDYARANGLLKEKDDNLEGDDVREGLAAVLSVKLREPQFEGQTKTKLGNPWVRSRPANGQPEARRVPGEPNGRAPDHPKRSTRRARGRRRGRRAS